MKLDILAIGVHPDDVELSASGTLLKHIKLGYKVGLLDLTKGELGSRGSAEIRIKEATEASDLMGASVRISLNMADGFFENTKFNQLRIIEVIRKFKPDIILANALNDRHPDHGRAAHLVHDACFLSGLLKIETKWKGENQEQWRPKNLFHYIQDHNLKPDFVVDISPFIEKKMEVILAYKSQFFNPNSSEPDTPISGRSFLDFIYAKNKSMGRNIGVDYAEGFNVSKIMGIQDLNDIL